MFVISAEITARPGRAADYEALLRKTIAEWSKSPCFVRFVLHRSEDDPHKFMLYEMFTSKEEYEVLRAGEFFQNQLKLRGDIVEPAPRRTDWLLVEEFGPLEK